MASGATSPPVEFVERLGRRARSERLAVRVLAVLAVWATVAYVAVFTLMVALGGERDPDKQAVIRMGGALLAIWCLGGGSLMRLGRDRLVALAVCIRLGWRTRFVLLCVVMALLEEAVTTGLTNVAHLFGGVTDAARITASKNYLEVVCLHSVVVFVPMFVGWAVLLSVWDFAPAEVMLCFGLTGWLAEWITFGSHNIGMVGMWTYVYGLMVYLPAWTVPADRTVRPVPWYGWPLAVLAGLLFGVPFVPVVLIIRWIMKLIC